MSCGARFDVLTGVAETITAVGMRGRVVGS